MRIHISPFFFAVLVAALSACSISGNDSSGEDESDDLKLTLSGPSVAAPSVTTEGFVAELIYADGTAAEDVYVSLIPTVGAVDAPMTSTGTNGATTDGFGRIRFAYRAPASISSETAVTIEARADTADLTAKTSLSLTVKPDTFGFTSPADGADILVGQENAVALLFQWMRAKESGSEGVAGHVTLTANSDKLRFLLNGASSDTGATVSVETTAANGGFKTSVAVYAQQKGPVTIEAVDDENSDQRASIFLTFKDKPTSINLVASPLEVQASPNENRLSNLTATVYNEQNLATSNVAVTFQLTNSISDSVNERVFPSGGTTSSAGEALSQYEAGAVGGTAEVTACVKDTTICSAREIRVTAPDAE